MSTPAKTVAVIGAGPSGLTAAKSLLEAGLSPTVFEVRKHVGGLWAPNSSSSSSSSSSSGITTTQLPEQMCTNASVISCSFSDWCYEEEAARGQVGVEEVGRYLRGYRERYLPEHTVRTGTQVRSVEKEDDGWWCVNDQERFEFLVVATGAFSEPYIPLVETLGKFKGTAVHSAHYVAEEILPLEETRKRRILVIGGCLSGAEVPADIALRIASMPEETRRNVELLHLFTKPPWILPKMLPFPNEADPTAPRVLTVDQVFFDARERPEPSSPEEKFRGLHTVLKAVMGTDQADLGPEYRIDDYWSTQPAAIGMSESYDKFVKSGHIKPVLGRFGGITEEGDVIVEAVEGSTPQSLTGVDTIVFATGYTPWPALRKIFSKEILRKMGIEPHTHNPPPSLLHRQLFKQVVHLELGRTIGFLGIQPRPFWAGMEIQSRWLASLFAGTIPWPEEEEILDHRKGTDHLMSLGKVYDANLLAAYGGYLEIIRDMSKTLNIDPLGTAAAAAYTPKPFVPAHLPPFGTRGANEYAASALRTVQLSVERNSYSARNIGRAVFAELQGKWKIVRRLESKLAGFPDGTFEGSAEFCPRLPTFTPTLDDAATGRWSPGPPPDRFRSLGRDVPEYLYEETGTLTTSSGLKLQGKRKYIYASHGGGEDVTAWFVKADGNSVDYFFHKLDFSKRPEDLGRGWGVEADGGWKAAAEHLCERDWYWPAYRFCFRAARLERWWVRYRVRGPQKDYVAETEYVRP